MVIDGTIRVIMDAVRIGMSGEYVTVLQNVTCGISSREEYGLVLTALHQHFPRRQHRCFLRQAARISQVPQTKLVWALARWNQ